MLVARKCAYLENILVPGIDLTYNFLKILLKNNLFKLSSTFILFLYFLLYIVKLIENWFNDVVFSLTNRIGHVLMNSDEVQSTAITEK
jgi:hypothetical protein